MPQVRGAELPLAMETSSSTSKSPTAKVRRNSCHYSIKNSCHYSIIYFGLFCLKTRNFKDKKS